MPAVRCLIALAEPCIADQIAAALTAAGNNALVVPDGFAALARIKAGEPLELLVTSLEHGPGKPNGLALALMARQKRPAIRVLFIGSPELRQHTSGVGAFIAWPSSAAAVTAAALDMIAARSLQQA